jgi:hypothetical protein
MTDKCCIGKDVRGVCFLSIPFDEMTDDDILRVRACEHTPYAIARWVYNCQYDELQVNPGFWLEDEYVRLITQGDIAMEGDIDDAIEEYGEE